MELFIVVFALLAMAEKFKVETAHAARGTVSPRWQRKLLEAERAGQPGYVPRYGSKDWAADLWGDFLRARTDARRATAVDRLHDVPFGQRVRRLFNGKAVREAELERATAEALDIARPTPAPLNPEPEIQADGRKVESDLTDVPCDNCGRSCQVRDYDPDGGVVLCEYCVDEHAEGVATERARRAPQSSDIRPEWKPLPNPDAADARVIPIFRKQEEENMSTEVTGLDPAIHYADSVAAAHDAHSAGAGETYVNGLARYGVGDETLGLVRHAQTKTQEAADAWRVVSTTLANENKALQEGYRNNPNAGNSDFQRGGS